MRYLVDTNTLSNEIIKNSVRRRDLFVIREVTDEYASTSDEVSKIQSSGISILDLEKRHYESMAQVLAKHGDNLELIRLYTNKGSSDIAMLAYILGDKNMEQKSLFPEEYQIVTKDKELIKVAKSYGITCVDRIPQ